LSPQRKSPAHTPALSCPALFHHPYGTGLSESVERVIDDVAAMLLLTGRNAVRWHPEDV
jgi:hypothetical protein